MYRVLLILLFISNPSHAETLTIGTPPYSPPFVMAADTTGKLIGFSIEIMSAICKRLAYTCHYKPLGFEQTFIQVLNNDISLAIGNITITPKRQEYFLFSLPYLPSFGQFIVRQDTQNLSLKTLPTFFKIKVGVEANSIYQDHLKKHFGDKIIIIPFENISNILFALYDESIKIALIDRETAHYWIANSTLTFKNFGPPIPMGIGIGIMANKTQQKLIDQVNTALLEIQANGEYQKTYNTYFADEDQIDNNEAGAPST